MMVMNVHGSLILNMQVEMEAVEAPDASKAGKVDAKEEKDTEETGTEGEVTIGRNI
jgi:hypothetical protein